ncbi:MAG: hypothetical protein ABEI96_01730 [Haloarculaceae archaeon]
MKSASFGGKPSPNHFLWTDGTRDSGTAGHKRFDRKTLREWCRKAEVDFETTQRVDHERSDESRRQYQCVFSWQDHANERFDIGDDTWEISTQKTPRTFLEIDSEGLMRVKSWQSEYVIDVEELWYDGPSLLFKSPEFDGTRRLDVRKLKSRE